MAHHFDFVHKEIGKQVPSRLANQLKFAAAQYASDFRMMALRHALKRKRIEIPKRTETSTIAMYLVLNDQKVR